MNKMLTGAVAALTAGAAIAAAVPASAQSYHGYRHHRDNSGAVVVAGIAGLAIGAALASDHGYRGGDYGYRGGDYGDYYGSSRGYYGGPGYYNGGGSYYGGYRRCHSDWRWNGRWRTYERVRVCW